MMRDPAKHPWMQSFKVLGLRVWGLGFRADQPRHCHTSVQVAEKRNASHGFRKPVASIPQRVHHPKQVENKRLTVSIIMAVIVVIFIISIIIIIVIVSLSISADLRQHWRALASLAAALDHGIEFTWSPDYS